MARIVKDLVAIDATPFLADGELLSQPKVVYDETEALTHALSITAALSDAGDLSEDECAEINEVLSAIQRSDLVVNNGDFYPRNLIRASDGRIVLIDWETWNDNSPFHVLDHPENVAAVPFVHMWGNPAWRERYVSELRRLLRFDEASVAKGIMLKALELARFWTVHRSGRALVAEQLALLRAAAL